MENKLKKSLVLTLSLIICVAMLASCFGIDNPANQETPDPETPQNHKPSDDKKPSEDQGSSDNQGSSSDDEYTNKEIELSLSECKAELTAVLKTSKAQKTVRFEEDDWIYSYYFNGAEDFLYFSGSKDGVKSEQWLGKFFGEYLNLYHQTDSERTIKKYEIYTKDEISEWVDHFREEIFQYLEYTLLDFIKDATSFKCIKKPGTTTVYEIEASGKDRTRGYTVSVVDGKLTKIVLSEDGRYYTSATYNYNTKITLADILAVYESSSISLNKENDFTAVATIASTYNTSVWYSIENTDVVLCKWGDWNGSTTQLTFTAQGNGTTKVYVYIAEEGDRKKAIDIMVLDVTVSGMETGSEGLKFTKKGDGYEVSIGNCTDTDIVIPAMYKGLPVTAIADFGFSESRIRSIILPESIIHIGYCAFAECEALTEIDIPDSVITIGDSAFSDCSNLRILKIGNNVESIDRFAFSQCRQLTAVVLPDSVQIIKSQAFYNCVRLTDLYLGSGLTDIYYGAFSGCSSLNHAFYNGSAYQWNKVINEGLSCEIFSGEQPAGDIVGINGKMTKILAFTGKYNGNMYLMAQFKDIADCANISEYRFVIKVYNTEGKLSYLYTYTIEADGTDSLTRLFELPYCANAKDYEVVISQIGIRYKDGHIERAFTDYGDSISTGTVLTNVDVRGIVKPDNIS